ncbi:MAG: hypothetical protein J6T52_09060 [Bacteroidaceae bacterium]|nr:hypothetical protein [Bacteroidaceae bacterium]
MLIILISFLRQKISKFFCRYHRNYCFWCIAFGDFQKRICGLTEPLLWIQLVAEGSSSTCRAFGVAMAKARRDNVEGSVFQ